MQYSQPALQRPLSWYRHLQLLLLAISYFAATYGRFTLGPLQETMRSSLSLTDIQIAWLQGPAMAIPMALGSVPVGLLVDRYCRMRLLVAFTVLSLIATVSTALAPSVTALFISRSVVGFASGAIVIAAYSLMCDLYVPSQRGRANMVATMGDTGAPPVAFALGGVLLGLSGTTHIYSHDVWRWALMWMCVPLLMAVMLQSMIREPTRTDIRIADTSLRGVWPRLWSYRALIVPILMARIMVWIADGAVLIWAAPNFERTFGLSPDQVAKLMATVLISSAILGPALGGPLADLCQKAGGPRRTMRGLCLAALLAIPAALFAIMPNPVLAGFMLGLFLTVGFSIGTAAIVVGTIVIPGDLRGTYVAITIVIGSLCSYGLAPLVVTYISEILGGPSQIGRALATVCVVMSTFGALAFGSAAHYFPERSEDAGPRL